ncbi:hypothetical protein, partial [Streptococcus anginosus]|uniref:hypothetical protein n=1 Tax=Streptococcus anginosus TaxID=1328 RepID=UPI0021F8C367
KHHNKHPKLLGKVEPLAHNRSFAIANLIQASTTRAAHMRDASIAHMSSQLTTVSCVDFGQPFYDATHT